MLCASGSVLCAWPLTRDLSRRGSGRLTVAFIHNRVGSGHYCASVIVHETESESENKKKNEQNTGLVLLNCQHRLACSIGVFHFTSFQMLNIQVPEAISCAPPPPPPVELACVPRSQIISRPLVVCLTPRETCSPHDRENAQPVPELTHLIGASESN